MFNAGVVPGSYQSYFVKGEKRNDERKRFRK